MNKKLLTRSNQTFWNYETESAFIFVLIPFQKSKEDISTSHQNQQPVLKSTILHLFVALTVSKNQFRIYEKTFILFTGSNNQFQI